MTARQLAVMIFAVDRACGVRLSPLERLALATQQRAKRSHVAHSFVCLAVKS